MMKSDLISVIVPTYNHEKFLPAAIQSILQQTYVNFEIIIVNDGSSDGTKDYLNQIHSTKIKVIHQDNQGLAAARNMGIKHAQGSLIALLDSDDMMDRQRLAIQANSLRDDPATHILYTSVNLIDGSNRFIGTIRREPIDPKNFLSLMYFRNQIPTPSTLLARRIVFETFPFNENLRIGEDLEWIIRCAHQFQFRYLDQPLTLYRRHKDNLSEDLSQLREIELSILKKYDTGHILKTIEESELKNKTLQKGKVLYIMDEYDAAIAFLGQLEDTLALFYLGNCYYKQNHFDQALNAYKASLAKDETNPACMNNLGVCLNQIGKPDEAKKFFRIAIELKQDYLDPLNQRFTLRELRNDLMPYGFSNK
jgi:glycosyltransferase involved in cell wall biosynthesis